MNQETVNLIHQAQSGDARAFHSLVALYDKRVMTLAFHLLQNEQDAEDLYQDVFMKVYTNINQFRFESDFFTWLYRITVNTAYNFKKRASRYARVTISDENESDSLDWIPDPNTALPDNSSDVKNAVMNAVKKLPQKQRTVFILKHLENLKIIDIAKLLDVSEGTVKKYLFRAMEKLRFHLKDYRYA
ncbi:MAG: RNA polymerase sigma factor [Candidatus Marinimicrobia bacterium]|nr:RNA polymerase sigma factor [Candidatus Neomarinimicrobiota bacterium]MBL7047469.1 RNA polymerase sigma factor [Candidatus Neomarinimicrobiota bacterium]